MESGLSIRRGKVNIQLRVTRTVERKILTQRKQHTTRAIRQQQKLTKLKKELAALRELEELGVGVGSKAAELIQGLEDKGVLDKLFSTGKPGDMENQSKDDQEWKCITRDWVNHPRPTQWWEEAANKGLLNGKGECSKRLKQLARKDRRNLKKSTENRNKVRVQLGENLWKHGTAGLATVGKPRGKKKNPALPVL